MQSTAAKRYAAALHTIAREQELTSEISAQLEELSELWQEQSGLRSLLINPRVEDSQKRKIIAEVGEQLQFGNAMTNLFSLMLDKGRIDILPALAREFRQLDDAHFGRARAHCRSAHPLTEAQLEQLRAKLVSIVGAKEVLITLENDPTLLAGFVVNIDGKLIDGSLKGRLLRLQRSLTQQKQQER